MYMIHSLEQAKEIFEEQRTRLQMETIDFYLLHTLNRGSFERAKNLGVIDYCEQLKREGKIRFLGFSFHDDFDVFKSIIDAYDWDFCQIQYNYRDQRFQAGTPRLRAGGGQGRARGGDGTRKGRNAGQARPHRRRTFPQGDAGCERRLLRASLGGRPPGR
jgi:predicted aldo/keto reductase-like oxidoreductase